MFSCRRTRRTLVRFAGEPCIDYDECFVIFHVLEWSILAACNGEAEWNNHFFNFWNWTTLHLEGLLRSYWVEKQVYIVQVQISSFDKREIKGREDGTDEFWKVEILGRGVGNGLLVLSFWRNFCFGFDIFVVGKCTTCRGWCWMKKDLTVACPLLISLELQIEYVCEMGPSLLWQTPLT